MILLETPAWRSQHLSEATYALSRDRSRQLRSNRPAGTSFALVSISGGGGCCCRRVRSGTLRADPFPVWVLPAQRGHSSRFLHHTSSRPTKTQNTLSRREECQPLSTIFVFTCCCCCFCPCFVSPSFATCASRNRGWPQPAYQQTPKSDNTLESASHTKHSLFSFCELPLLQIFLGQGTEPAGRKRSAISRGGDSD